MSSDNRIEQYIISTQIDVFADARRELQLPLKVIAADSGIPYPTVVAYAEGRHALSLAALKRLLNVKGMAPLLSRLFEPEDHSLVTIGANTDHDEFGQKAIELVQQIAAAHRPDSECAEKIGPTEHKTLTAKRTQLRAVA